MTRDDVIDVLTAVAAGDRRTVGEADVTMWVAVIGDISKDLALEAVVDHFCDRPGVWLEPGHVVQRARAIRRDMLERESDAERMYRQEAQAVKAADGLAAVTAGVVTGPTKKRTKRLAAAEEALQNCHGRRECGPAIAEYIAAKAAANGVRPKRKRSA